MNSASRFSCAPQFLRIGARHFNRCHRMQRYEFEVQGMFSWRRLAKGEAVHVSHYEWAKFQAATKDYLCLKCHSHIPRGSPYCRFSLTSWGGAYDGVFGPKKAGPRCLSCSPVSVRAIEIQPRPSRSNIQTADRARRAKRQAARITRLTPSRIELTAAASELIRDRPPAWEYFLLARVMEGCLASCTDLRRDWLAKAALPSGERMNDCVAYIGAQTGGLGEGLKRLNRLIPQQFNEAIGPPGTPADADQIVSVGSGVIDVYRYLLQWAIDIRTAQVPPEYLDSTRLLAGSVTGLIREIEGFVARYKRTVAKIPTALKKKTPLDLTIVLNLEVLDLGPAADEITRVARQQGLTQSLTNVIREAT